MCQRELQGLHPSRFCGDTFSFGGDLYTYGGMPTDMFLAGIGDRQPYGSADPFMLKLNPECGTWEPVSFEGAPQEKWTRKQVFSKGLLKQMR